jgi:hypothetical protein
MPERYGSIIQDTLLRGRKANDEFKRTYQYKAQDHPNFPGPGVKGMAQGLVIHAANSASYSVIVGQPDTLSR